MADSTKGKESEFSGALTSVELADNRSHDFTYVGSVSSYWSISLSFLIIFALFLIHSVVLVPQRPPPGYGEQFQPVSSPGLNSSVVVVLLVQNLAKKHERIDISCSLIRSKVGSELNSAVEFNTNAFYLKDGEQVNSSSTTTKSSVLSFNSTSNTSIPIEILGIPIGNFDSIRTKVQFSGDFSPFSGVLFKWRYNSFYEENAERNATILIILLSIYPLVVFLLKSKLVPSLTKVMLISLAVLSLISSNPLSLISEEYGLSPLVLTAFQKSFIALYRSFIVIQIVPMTSLGPQASKIAIAVSIILIASLAVFDFQVTIDRIAATPKDSNVDLYLSIAMTAVYSILITKMFISPENRDTKMGLICVFMTIFTIIVPFLDFFAFKNWKDLMYEAIPLLMHVEPHASAVALALLFFQETEDGRVYQEASINNPDGGQLAEPAI